MIGSLLYLTATRPDIQFAVCLCACFQASPRTSHRQAVKHIFRYLKFTLELGLLFSLGSSLSLRGFLDADFAGCWIDRKSTSGTYQFLGSSLVSWPSRKQSSVAQSTTKAEYVAAASCCSQLLWMKATPSDFGLMFGRIPLLVDSTSAISVAKNPVLHSRTKHIDVRFHFLRDSYKKGDIDLIHVETQNQLADIFTKPLESSAFAHLRGELGVCYPLLAWGSFCSLGFVFTSSLLLSCFFCILYHIMHCIHVSYAFLLTLALELLWNVQLVLACARLYRCLLDHGWLSSLESVEYLLRAKSFAFLKIKNMITT